MSLLISPQLYFLFLHADAHPSFTAKAHRPSKADFLVFPFAPLRVATIPSPLQSNSTQSDSIHRLRFWSAGKGDQWGN
jgi:hypothetical protein